MLDMSDTDDKLEMAFRMLDEAVGFAKDPCDKCLQVPKHAGKTRYTRLGLQIFAFPLLRHIEYERMAGYLRMHWRAKYIFLAEGDMHRSHLKNKYAALKYLRRAMTYSDTSKDTFAKKVFNWIFPGESITANPPTSFEQCVTALNIAINRKEREKATSLAALLVEEPPASQTEHLAEGAFQIGDDLLRGSDDFEEDIEEAQKYLEMAVDQNPSHAAAANNLGLTYLCRWIPPNWVEAKEMFELSFAAGDRTKAPRNLAYVLSNGHEVKRDYRRAMELLLLQYFEAEDDQSSQHARISLWRLRSSTPCRIILLLDHSLRKAVYDISPPEANSSYPRDWKSQCFNRISDF